MKLPNFYRCIFILIILFIQCTKQNLIPTDLRINDKVLYNEYQNNLKEVSGFAVLSWDQIDFLWEESNKICKKHKLKQVSKYKYSIFEHKSIDDRQICNWNFSKELIYFLGNINNLEVKINFYGKYPSSYIQIDENKNELRRDWQWIAKNGKWYSTLTYLELKDFKKNKLIQYYFNRYNGILEKKEEYLILKNKNLKDGWIYEYYQNGEEKCFYWIKGKLTNESPDKCQLSSNLINTKIFLEQKK